MARHTRTDDDFLAMALIGYEAQIAKIVAAIADIQAKLGHRVQAVQELRWMGWLQRSEL
jgi:hypothetical protein